jgi:hypothetical protein
MDKPRRYPAADIKILYGRAAGICSFASCRKNLILKDVTGDNSKQIGKIAHIVAHSPTGPRGDASYPQEKLDSYENWILLCPTCHELIDARPILYNTETLRQIKQEHEAWVEATIYDQAMSNVTFAELEVAAKAISTGQHIDVVDFHIISPEEKISKNNLTNLSRGFIVMGLSRSAEVGKFLMQAAMLDADFPDRLKNGFKQKYCELNQTDSGDALFFGMLNFATQSLKRDAEKAAALAILVHLFHICEVFEK